MNKDFLTVIIISIIYAAYIRIQQYPLYFLLLFKREMILISYVLTRPNYALLSSERIVEGQGGAGGKALFGSLYCEGSQIWPIGGS